MATFPESSPTPLYPLIIEPEFKTLISDKDGGGEQRRQKLLYPKYNVTVEYNPLSISDAKTIWEFYIARKGASEAFYIYDFSLLPATSFNHSKEYCGTGDGTTTIFDIPGKSTSSQTIYMDGIDETSNVTILTGGGESNSDRAQFDVAAPVSGKIITADFTGLLRMRVRFLEDKMTREAFNYKLFQYGLKLKGLSAQ
jgi:hypothetical protein